MGVRRNVALLPVRVDVELQELVRAVVAHHELGPGAVPHRRPQRLNGVHAAAVAGKTDNGLVRVGQLGPHGARKPDAQRAAAGHEIVPWRGGRQVARQARRTGKAFVEDDGISRNLLGQHLRELRHVQRAFALLPRVGGAVGGFSLFLGGLDCGRAAGAAFRIAGRAAGFQGIGQGGQRQFRVAYHA